MNRSFGEMEDSKSNQSLYFNIVYKTTIKSFATTDHQYHRNMTINVADSVNLLCNVESNPKSNISISFNGEILNDTTGSDSLFFQLSEANCSNAGIYVCSGANEYNYGSNATREFTVYVKCQPQPSTDMGLVQNISAALHSSKTLRFRVLPYLDSGVTTFNWFKQDTPVDNYIEHSGRIHVWSSSIESNLTINSVSESDFGEYRIEYNNSVGFNSFTFYLQGEKALVTSPTDIETSKYVGVVAACASGVVVIIVVIAGSIYLYKKRHKTEPGTSTYQNVPFGSNGRQRKESTQSLDINETRFEALQEVDDVPKETNESAVYTNSLDIIEKIERVEVSELLSYVLGKSEDSFAADFKKLPSDLQKPCIFARKPENLPLNRYNGIYPCELTLCCISKPILLGYLTLFSTIR
ncbi:uncharacterized protein LOC128551813 [Mercenaria mercenaria]|uniref:uncharacterized protein LOC128551813 n=1 Tax=Mercenaria mercenaria TaxID=6596 RepID=UPI00234EFA66|nr:uncharacterized protein LOC128551813 [Mercenaria mercenaria]